MSYEDIKAEIKAAPMTWLPGLLVCVVKTSLEKKVFKPGGAARIASEVESEALGQPEAHNGGSLKQPCCGAPCVVNTIQTADKATCVYLRDGTKVTVERDATTKGPAWLKVSQQARITPAQHNS